MSGGALLNRFYAVGLLALGAIAPAWSGDTPIAPVSHVDLPRFMGHWYIVADIPTRFEAHAWDAVQTYQLNTDGSIQTSLAFHDGAANGPIKQAHAKAYVLARSSGAIWGVQVFWPLKAQYIVAYLASDYSAAIVARDARDYVWILSRNPHPSSADYNALLDRTRQLGYDMSRLHRVDQAGGSALPGG